MTAYILRIRYPHGQSISAVMGRRPFWPPNWDAAGTPIVAAFDRRVPFIGFACCVAATGKVNVLTLMAVSETFRVRGGRGAIIRIPHGRLLHFLCCFLCFPYYFRVMKIGLGLGPTGHW